MWSPARPLSVRARVTRLGKAAVASVALHSGVLRHYRRRRASSVILLYHRVVSGATELVDYSPYGISVRQQTFERQMAFLARHYDVVPLAAITTPAVGGRPRCAITFDDGWRDNLTAAWQVLKRHEFPFTVFLATNLMTGGAWFWEERVMASAAHCHQLWRNGASQALEQHLVDPDLAAAVSGPTDRLPSALAALVGRLRVDDARRQSIETALDRAVRQPGCQPSSWFLSWDDVREMHAAGVDFGGHTASHLNLERAGSGAAAADIQQSAEALSYHLGVRARSFAYPYGKYTSEARKAVAAAGFASACTTHREAVHEGCDLFELPRIDVYEDVSGSTALFACRIALFLRAF